jgi:dienelactone hydrolase
MPSSRTLAAGALAAVLAASLVTSPAAPAAAANPYERGPAPTLALLQADAGPFAVTATTVDPGQVSGFGGGTIYHPTGTTGTFGGVAIAPGFLAPGSTLSWLAKRVASHGFVVILIDTLRRGDGPTLRSQQLLAALDYLGTASAARTRVDADRLSVMGHSMGGGGTIEAANARPTLKAAVPLTPWHSVKSWPQLRVPILVVGAEADTTAPPAEHAEPFYEGMSAAPEKAYLELDDADHRAPIRPDTGIGVQSVAWLKRFVDDDTRYQQFLCPPPAAGGPIEEYRDTCD